MTTSQDTTKTKVLLVDDHAIVRDSLARRLEDEPDLLIHAIRTVVDGGVFLSDEVRGRFESESSGDDQSKTKLSTLTTREVDVLRWVGMGQSRKQMAGQLGISENTVAVHTNRIMKKLDIHDRVGLARFAIKIGLSPLDEPS